MHLNWDSAIHFHPTSLAPALRGIPVPTYGNYGDPDIRARRAGRTFSMRRFRSTTRPRRLP
jgi:hypothetical protein